MTWNQIKAALISRGLSRKGKNTYTQGSKRTWVAKGYSDCSAFARWCVLMVTGVDIGINTNAQMASPNLYTTKSGGKLPSTDSLQVGDLVYFGPTEKIKSNHVEVVLAVGPTLDKCKLIGHGGGKGPTVKSDAKSYIAARGGCKMVRRLKLISKAWTTGERIMSLGCYGEDVAWMQSGLIRLGFALGTDGADMDFGPATDAAVRKYQKTYGLTVDGEFGPKSLAKMLALPDKIEPALPTEHVSLTEDDYPADDDTPDEPDPDGDPPTDEPAETSEDDYPEDEDETAEDAPSATPDAAMGASAVNPYPMPTSNKQRGATGPAVRWIQWELHDSGILTVLVNGKQQALKIDGDFGPITGEGVRMFQRRYGLVVDGVVGPKTRAAMLAYSDGEYDPAPAPPAATPANGKIIDVSHHDGVIDWAKVAASDQLAFAFVRIQDNTTLDRQLSNNVKGAEKHGIKYGHYMFFRAATAAAAEKEVDMAVARAKAAGTHAVNWVLDVEITQNTVAAVKAGVARLRALLLPAGTQVGVYIAHQLYPVFKGTMPLFDFVWIPRYNGWKTPPAYPYDLWQGGPTAIPGIRDGAKNVDSERLRPGLTLPQLLTKRAK